MFRQILEKMIDNCDGAVAAVMMGFDGIAVETVSQDEELDVQSISMEFSFVLGQVRKASDILEVGALQEVSIRSENLVFLIRVLNEEYFIGMALKPEGNFGKARFLLRMSLDDFKANL